MLNMPTAEALGRYLDLASQQMKLTAANMANQTTQGYTRRSVSFGSGDSVVLGSPSGSSVVATVTAQRDTVLQRAVLQATEASSGSSTRFTALNNLQSLFAINSSGGDASGIGAAIDDFFTSANALASDPTNSTLRQTLYIHGQTLASTMNRAATQISSQTGVLDQQVTASAGQVNVLLGSVASLNKLIVNSGPGSDSSALQDQRDVALTQLAKLVDVNPVTAKDGSIALSLSDGTPLVSGSNVSALSMPVVNGTVQLMVGSTNVTAAIHGGSMGGALQARDQDLPAVTAKLDVIANSIAIAVNAQNAAGVDASGNAGGPVFAGHTAATLALAISSGDGIAASADGSNAAAIAGLGTQTISNGSSPSAAFSLMISALGQTASIAQTSSTADGAVLTQTSTQLSSVSAVSLDTEAANLTQYQRSYEAAAKLLAIVNSLMAQAINLGTETAVS